MKRSKYLSLLLACLALAVTLTASRPAHAYGWMIRHEYTGCSPCHADPSGGGLLTPYGRAQGEVLLRSHYSRADDGEAGKVAEFAFGAIKLPESILLGADLRGGYLESWLGPPPATGKFLAMQADLEGQLSVDRFRVNASVGYGRAGAANAWVTHAQSDNLVSRVHWVGVDLGESRSWLVRAGRMNVPYAGGDARRDQRLADERVLLGLRVCDVSAEADLHRGMEARRLEPFDERLHLRSSCRRAGPRP